jgi:predicted enzyme related to lactoylglutathione lyase/uncharacterized glyoxalase superfamily protein PhnB
MTDPFDALRIPLVPVPPDPDFARALRARVERALLGTDEEPAPSPEKMALHAVTPYLTVVDAPAAVAFYVAAFGARRRGEPIAMPDGRIGHAEIVVGDSVLMLAEEFPELDLLAPIHRGGASQSLHVELDDPDAAVERAVARGAVLERPVTDSSHGRGGVVRDLSGHRWMVSEPSGPRSGEISYAALWTRNVALAGRFYARVLGWTTVPSPDREGRPVRQVTDLAMPVGIRGTDRAPTLALHYVVPDVDAAVALVRAAGGTAAEPTDRSDGRTADCVDDQGLPFALVAPATGLRRHTSGRGELDYVLLRVPDATRARAFYGTVLGWRFRPGTGSAYWHPEPSGGPSYPGMGLEGGHAEATAVPWFRVPDLDAAVATVRAAGGRRIGPVRRRRGGGPRIECADDQGARFGLTQL